MIDRYERRAHISTAKQTYANNKHYQSLSTQECVDLLGVSKTTINRWQKEFKVVPYSVHRKAVLDAKINAMLASDEFGLESGISLLSQGQLSVMFQIKPGAVQKLQAKHLVKPLGYKFVMCRARTGQGRMPQPADVKFVAGELSKWGR